MVKVAYLQHEIKLSKAAGGFCSRKPKVIGRSSRVLSVSRTQAAPFNAPLHGKQNVNVSSRSFRFPHGLAA